MPLHKLPLMIALALCLSACGDDRPHDEIKRAVEQPINATNQAVLQVEDTEKRMKAALDEASGSSPASTDDQATEDK